MQIPFRFETEPEVSAQDTPSQRSTARATRTTQGLLFVLSAPSGTGKDTVIHALKAQGMDFHVVASVTTRAMRPGESEGNPYYFVSQQRFDEMVANNELLEYAQVHGNWYGQPLQQIRDNIQSGRDVLLKIDVQGAATVRKKISGAVFIFLVPGSPDELVMRLNSRHTETEEERKRRLDDAQRELAQQDNYDYVVVNRQGHLQDAVDCLRAIMLAEHCRTHPRIVTL
jgi:guanylate kinase